jgi:hypothetical protein
LDDLDIPDYQPIRTTSSKDKARRVLGLDTWTVTLTYIIFLSTTFVNTPMINWLYWSFIVYISLYQWVYRQGRLYLMNGLRQIHSFSHLTFFILEFSAFVIALLRLLACMLILCLKARPKC